MCVCANLLGTVWRWSTYFFRSPPPHTSHISTHIKDSICQRCQGCYRTASSSPYAQRRVPTATVVWIEASCTRTQGQICSCDASECLLMFSYALFRGLYTWRILSPGSRVAPSPNTQPHTSLAWPSPWTAIHSSHQIDCHRSQFVSAQVQHSPWLVHANTVRPTEPNPIRRDLVALNCILCRSPKRC